MKNFVIGEIKKKKERSVVKTQENNKIKIK